MRLNNKVMPAVLAACVLAACGGGNAANGMLPAQQPSIQNSNGSAPQAPGGPSVSSDATTSGIVVSGKIASTYKGGFTLSSSACGNIHVLVTSSTSITGTDPTPGLNVSVKGSGSCATSIAATSVTTTTGGSAIALTGSIASTYAGGFTLSSSGCGNVHVATNSSTSITGTTSPGTKVNVKGTGSCATSIVATAVTPIAGAISTKHVLTEDYLGSPFGTSSVSWSAAAPYLTWAQTGTKNADAIHAAGILTQAYTDPNRTSAGTGDPLYTSNEATFAHDCSGNRVYDTYNGNVKQYVMDVGGSPMQALYAKYVKSLLAQAHFDSIFEDGAGTLSADAAYTPFSGMPCGYTDSAWISDEEDLNQVVSLPIYMNGLDALYNDGVSQNVQILNSSNTAGGDFEGCYTDDTTKLYYGWAWQAVENTELQVTAKYRRFLCQLRNTGSASASIPLRIYAMASFLMTYNPSTSILWEEFATPSAFHVEPESELVALDPLVAEPSSIASLKTPGGNYGREYSECFVGGTSAGACAVVVNSDTTAHPFPYSGYARTLVLGGGGILDGGTISTGGAAPASSVPAKTAVIAFK